MERKKEPRRGKEKKGELEKEYRRGFKMGRYLQKHKLLFRALQALRILYVINGDI